MQEVWSMNIPEFRFVSLNNSYREHWASRARRQRKMWELFRALAPSHVPEFTYPVVLTITREWGHRGRAMDMDNLVASCKPLIDCLKEPKGRSKYGLGIIPDDDPSHIELVVKQRKSEDGIPRALVHIESKEESDVRDDD